MQIAEGQTGTAQAGVELVYPGVNSCLSLTAVQHSAGIRYGGHAVLVPEEGQLTLPQICSFLSGLSDIDVLYIIGGVGTWDDNWSNLPQTQNFMIGEQPIRSVFEMAEALGYKGEAGNLVIWDIDNEAWGASSYDVYFEADAARSLYGQRGQDPTHYLIPNVPAW